MLDTVHMGFQDSCINQGCFTQSDQYALPRRTRCSNFQAFQRPRRALHADMACMPKQCNTYHVDDATCRSMRVIRQHFIMIKGCHARWKLYGVEVTHGQAEAGAGCKATAWRQHHDCRWLKGVLWLHQHGSHHYSSCMRGTLRIQLLSYTAMLTGKRSLPMYQPPA